MRVTMGVTEIGPVTNPKLFRDKLGIVPGSEVDFVDRGETIVVEPRDRTANTEEIQQFFLAWAESVRGTIDTCKMDGKAYVDWMRGPRDDLGIDWFQRFQRFALQ